MEAKGHFEIKMAPEAISATAADSGIGRMSLDKQYHGDIEGHSTGEMLGYRNMALGAGGYVAMETVHGTLGGRAGSFTLQHSSTMDAGVGTQSIQVVPGSGSGALAGLTGQLLIIQADGRHTYEFTYTLPNA